MKDPYYDRSEISNSDLSELKRQLYGGMGIDPVHAKFGNLIDHMITEPKKVDYFKLTCAGAVSYTHLTLPTILLV